LFKRDAFLRRPICESIRSLRPHGGGLLSAEAIEGKCNWREALRFAFTIKSGGINVYIYSFFKRRMKISPGQAWVPADQLDFIAGGLLVLSCWVRLSWLDILSVLTLSFLGDIAVNHVSFYLGVRDTKW
jgi:hypothetical protein